MQSLAHARSGLERLFAVLSHRHRLHIVEELDGAERDVASLQSALGITHPRVSQHLALLRSAAVVAQRRVGRHVFYRLAEPAIAAWIVEAVRFADASPDAATPAPAASETRRSQPRTRARARTASE